MAYTLAALRTQVRQRADIENDGNHISDAEITTLLNNGIESLWSNLGTMAAANFFAVQAPQLTPLGDNSFLLPNNFGRLVEVSVKYSSIYHQSTPADPEHISYLATEGDRLTGATSFHYLHYNLDQGRMELFVYPAPASSDLSVRYIPTPQVLSLDADILKLPPLFQQWVVWDAVVSCLGKREQDSKMAMLEREKVEKRVLDYIDSMEVTRAFSIRRERGTGGLLPDASRGV